MKRNRVNENRHVHSADKMMRTPTSENTLVFLVVAIFLLAVITFSNTLEFISHNKKIPASAVIPVNYVWIDRAPEMREGLYLFTSEHLENKFPGLLQSSTESSFITGSGPRVFAIQYTGNSPAIVNLPPNVANIFFLPISINRANKNILSTLPGIGPVLAERIVQRRKENGPFRSKDELLHITGIGPGKLTRLSHHIVID